MNIHKEGRFFLIVTLIICLLLNLINIQLQNLFFKIFSLLSTFIFVFALYFFRVRPIKINKDDKNIFAPCDGKIVVIEETIENEYYKEKKLQVSIFMSPLNVHNNLYPISGKIKYTKYHPGKYLFAWNPKASTDNERSTIVIENKSISVLCRQIAGALARRIVTYAKLNTDVNCGEELGFIKFGSRVDLFLPIGTKINPKIGDNVIGGESIIAKFS